MNGKPWTDDHSDELQRICRKGQMPDGGPVTDNALARLLGFCRRSIIRHREGMGLKTGATYATGGRIRAMARVHSIAQSHILKAHAR